MGHTDREVISTNDSLDNTLIIIWCTLEKINRWQVLVSFTGSICTLLCYSWMWGVHVQWRGNWMLSWVLYFIWHGYKYLNNLRLTNRFYSGAIKEMVSSIIRILWIVSILASPNIYKWLQYTNIELSTTVFVSWSIQRQLRK